MARDTGNTRKGGGGDKKKRPIRKIMLGPFRGAFVHLMEPEMDDYGNEKYKIVALFPPGYDLKPLEDLVYEAFEEEFGKDEADWPSGKNDRLPQDVIFDCGDKRFAKYDGYKKGWRGVSMSTYDPPGIVDADCNEILNKREIYSGRWYRAQANVSAYDNRSKGVGVYINHAQALDHDEQLGGGRGRAEDEFDDWKGEIKEVGQDRGRDRDDRDRGRDRDDRDERRGRDREDEGRSRRSSRSEDREDDRRGSRDEGRSRGRGRDEDAQEEEDRGGRSRGHDRSEREERGSRRGDDRDEDRGRRSSRDRDEREDDRPRGRDRDEARETSRSRRDSRDDDGGREDDRRSSRRDRDDDRRPSRDRDDEDRGSRRSSRDDDEWN